jgi:hypothetical protein
MGDDDPSGKKTVSPPAGIGLLEGTTEGAFMVLSTVDKTRRLLEQLKMPEVELMTPRPWGQRTWFAVVPSSPLLELAIAAAAAGKWVIASVDGCDVKWRFEVKGAPPPKRNQRQSPTKPSVRPSVAPQRAAGTTPASAWGRPLSHTSQRVPPIPSGLSKEDVSDLIKAEIASRLEQYEQQLAAAKAKSKRRKAELKDREEVITGLNKELAALKDQAKSSANAAATPSPPDLQVPPEKQERWAWQREIREVTKEVKEIAQKYTAVQVEQIRGTGEVVAMRQNHSALERQLEALQQLLVAEREARQLQLATRSRKSGPTGAVVPPPPPSQVFNFGGENSQQPLPPAPVWPAHNGDFVFGRAASAGVAPAEPEDEKETVVVRPLELASGAKGEGEEGRAEGEQQPENIWQVAPQLATPAKLPPAVLDPAVKTTRGRSPGGTPSRGEVVRRNAADRMEDELEAAMKWAVVVRRRPLFGDLDQNFPAVQEH